MAQPRILAFWAANSSSVRMPSALSWASSRSLAMGSSSGAAGGGAYCGSGAYSCWGSGWSLYPQRVACRRDTRLLTAVAVPATTAVRATPRSSPGIWCSSWSVGRLDRVERGEDGLDLEPAAGDELAAGAPDRHRDGGRPAVLPHEQRGRGAGGERLGGLAHVVLADEPGRGALEGFETGVAAVVGREVDGP